MIKYKLIEIFTSEDMHWKNKPLYWAVIEAVQALKTSARCIVTHGLAGSYENGEITSSRVEVLSYRMPLKIEILIPESEVDLLLPTLEKMVLDGIIIVCDTQLISHKTEKHLIPRHLNVKDAMTSNPISTGPDVPLSEIITTFISKGLFSIPVIDSKKVPIGIVTESDLIQKADIPIRIGLLSQFGEKVDELLANLQKLKVGEIMSTPVYTIQEDAFLTHAVEKLLKHNIKRLPVITKEGSLCGILSIYDLFQTVTHQSPDSRTFEKHIELTNVKTVSRVMVENCPKVPPETSIEDVIGLIDASPLQRVAVVDSDGKFLGLIFDHDLLSLFSEHADTIWDHLLGAMSFTEIGRLHKEKIRMHQRKFAKEVMRTKMITVRDDAPLEVAVRLISENKIRFLPVIDKEGLFKGIVSRDALLMASFNK